MSTWMAICIVFLTWLPDDQAAIKSISPERVAGFQRALQQSVFTFMPTPLFEGSDHWGDMKKSVNGMKWSGGKPELQYADKNQGTWRKYKVTLNHPHQDHLRLQLNDVKNVGNNALSFLLKVEADIEFDVQQQNWQSGVKLFDGSVRGRTTVKLALRCESKLSIEPGVSVMPVLKYRLRVVDAKASYDDLVFTHVPGLGGSAAKVVGNWTVDAVQQMKPSLEKKLIEKLTQKIVKAADTKEIQVSLTGIERKK